MYGTIRKYVKLVKVTCFKPAQPAWRAGFGWAPTSEELHHLAPLERALKKALAGQRVRFDAEALDEAFAPLLKAIGDLQGIRPYAVDLTQQAISAVFEPVTGEPVALLEVPEDLRKLKEDVRELTVGCGFLEAVPDWIGEFRHLEMLHLDPTSSSQTPAASPAPPACTHHSRNLHTENSKSCRPSAQPATAESTP